MSAKKPKKGRRGRPTLSPDVRPWLELMHPHVIALRSKRKAAALIALRHQHEIPLGCAHQRTLTSTIDLLRHKYAEWRKALAEAEAVRARAQQTLGQMAEAAAVIQAATAEYQPVLGRLTADFDKVLNEPRMQAMLSIAQPIKPDAALKAFGDLMEPSVLGQLQGVAERASRLFPHDLMNQIPQFKVSEEFAEIFSPEYSQSLRNMGQALEAVMGPTLKPFEKP
jgi:hypothetical protein